MTVRARARGAGNRGGFTLIEMVVVLLVLSAIAAVTLPAWLDSPEADDMTVATRRIHALFQLARDSAARGGSGVTVVIDSASTRVWLDVSGASAEQADYVAARGSAARRAGPAPAGEELELPAAVKVQLSTMRARFTFAPTGAVYADSLWLVSPLGTRLITLQPWTGDVLVH